MSLNFIIGPGFGLKSPQHNSSFDNKINNTSSMNSSKNKIMNNNDKGKMRLRGLNVMLEGA